MVDNYKPRQIVWRGDYYKFGVILNMANDNQAEAGGELTGKVFRLNAEECKWTYKSDKKERSYGSPDGKPSRYFLGKVTEELEFSKGELHAFAVDMLSQQRMYLVDATIIIYANSARQAGVVEVMRFYNCLIEEASGEFKNNEEFSGTIKFLVTGPHELVNPSMVDENLAL